MVEEYRFDHDEEKKGGIGKFIWNSETREFCGRDGASWGKVSLFYAIFYACLGSFFVGMLAVFVSFMPRDKPTYYGESSTMNIRGLNPGLGFRPQIDVEDHQIVYNPIVQDDLKLGRRKYFDNLKNFLDAKYGDLSAEDEANVIKCESGRSFDEELRNGKSCQYKHNEIFESTDCTESNSFGFKTHRPCILLKLNKIISWKPANDSVEIRCQGETSVDSDNIVGITYHSEGNLNNKEHGLLDSKYFPFFAQKSYRAPFVWAQFDLKPNTLVNIECKAYAANIDNSDRLNRRGQTKFSLFVSNTF